MMRAVGNDGVRTSGRCSSAASPPSRPRQRCGTWTEFRGGATRCVAIAQGSSPSNCGGRID